MSCEYEIYHGQSLGVKDEKITNMERYEYLSSAPVEIMHGYRRFEIRTMMLFLQKIKSILKHDI